MFDLISIGDVTEDVFIQVDHAATLSCDARHTRVCHLKFPFGSKVGIKRVDKLLGGNAGNMAIGSSRLGLRAALYAEVGADSQGEVIYRSFKDNNVSTTYFFQHKGEKTNYSVVLYLKDDRTILVHHEKRHYRFPSLAPSRWVYLTSMAEGNQKIFLPLLRYLAKTKVKLGFNPGTFQLSLGLSKLKPILKRCTFLCLNKEEAQKLLANKSMDVRVLLRKLHETGPQIVVITDGEKGTYCYDGTQYLYCPIYDVPCLERTGAGDAFATGFLCALLYKKSIEEALRWGTINAASVIQRIGPQEGLICRSLLNKILHGNPQFTARVFQGAEVTTHTVYHPQRYKTF